MKVRLLFTLLCLATFTASFTQNYKFKKVSTEELLQKENMMDPNAKAAILYRETRSNFPLSFP